MRIAFDRLPWLPGAQEFGDQWVYPAGAHNNRQYFSHWVRFDARIGEAQQVLCFSPETSGGLLMAVQPERVRRCSLPDQAWVIGEVVTMDAPCIEVVTIAG